MKNCHENELDKTEHTQYPQNKILRKNKYFIQKIYRAREFQKGCLQAHFSQIQKHF